MNFNIYFRAQKFRLKLHFTQKFVTWKVEKEQKERKAAEEKQKADAEEAAWKEVEQKVANKEKEGEENKSTSQNVAESIPSETKAGETSEGVDVTKEPVAATADQQDSTADEHQPDSVDERPQPNAEAEENAKPNQQNAVAKTFEQDALVEKTADERAEPEKKDSGSSNANDEGDKNSEEKSIRIKSHERESTGRPDVNAPKEASISEEDEKLQHEKEKQEIAEHKQEKQHEEGVVDESKPAETAADVPLERLASNNESNDDAADSTTRKEEDNSTPQHATLQKSSTPLLDEVIALQKAQLEKPSCCGRMKNKMIKEVNGDDSYSFLRADRNGIWNSAGYLRALLKELLKKVHNIRRRSMKSENILVSDILRAETVPFDVLQKPDALFSATKTADILLAKPFISAAASSTNNSLLNLSLLNLRNGASLINFGDNFNRVGTLEQDEIISENIRSFESLESNPTFELIANSLSGHVRTFRYERGDSLSFKHWKNRRAFDSLAVVNADGTIKTNAEHEITDSTELGERSRGKSSLSSGSHNQSSRPANLRGNNEITEKLESSGLRLMISTKATSATETQKNSSETLDKLKAQASDLANTAAKHTQAGYAAIKEATKNIDTQSFKKKADEVHKFGRDKAGEMSEFFDRQIYPKLPKAVKTNYILADNDAEIHIPHIQQKRSSSGRVMDTSADDEERFAEEDSLAQRVDVSESDSEEDIQSLPIFRLIIRALLTQLFYRGDNINLELQGLAPKMEEHEGDSDIPDFCVQADSGKLSKDVGISKPGLLFTQFCRKDKLAENGKACDQIISCLENSNGNVFTIEALVYNTESNVCGLDEKDFENFKRFKNTEYCVNNSCKPKFDFAQNNIYHHNYWHSILHDLTNSLHFFMTKLHVFAKEKHAVVHSHVKEKVFPHVEKFGNYAIDELAKRGVNIDEVSKKVVDGVKDAVPQEQVNGWLDYF